MASLDIKRAFIQVEIKDNNEIENMYFLDNNGNKITANIDDTQTIFQKIDTNENSIMNSIDNKYIILSADIKEEQENVKYMYSLENIQKIIYKNPNYDTLKENIKKIYRYINIDNDKPGKKVYIPNMFKYKTISGGEITYIVNSPEKINSEDLKKLKFKPNSSSIDNSTPNIIIIGGGPVGLYMSILLQKLYDNKMKIYILEKQRDGSDERSLERGQVLVLNKLTLNNGSHQFEIYPELFKKENIAKYIPNQILDLLFKEDNVNVFSFLNYILNEDITLMPINILEYKLANYAQSIGVNILHTPKMITLENINQYQNDNTKFIFDAVGGRFRNYTYIKETKYDEDYYTYSGYNITNSNDLSIKDKSIKFDDNNYILITKYGDCFYSTENYDTNTVTLVDTEYNNRNINIENKVGPFKITTRSLDPENAIIENNGLLVIPIGNSYMQTDFHNGNGIYYGFMISLLIAIEVFNNFKI